MGAQSRPACGWDQQLHIRTVVLLLLGKPLRFLRLQEDKVFSDSEELEDGYLTNDFKDLALRLNA